MNRPRFIAALALGVAAFGLTLAATESPGPGLDPDAVSYVLSATTLVHSGTLLAPTYDWDSEDETVPLAHFPPGFPVAIAAGHALGMTTVQSARMVVALSALLTVATIAWLVADAVGLIGGLLAGALVMITPALVDTHLAILSEPLFLACLALTVLAMTRDRDRPLIYGLFAAAACMVRYAGIAAPAAVVLWALVRAGTARERIRRVAFAGAPSAIVLALWVLRALTLERERIRQFGVYADLGATMAEGANTVSQWLAPVLAEGPLCSVVTVAMLLLIAALITVVLRSSRGIPARDVPRRVIAACGLMSGLYLIVLVVARVAADPGIPFDFRLLAPVLLMTTVVVSVVLALWWRERAWWQRAAAVAIIGAWSVGSAYIAMADARYALQVGVDFADEDWRGSHLIDWVRKNGGGYALFTNFPTALYFHADRLSFPMPGEASPAIARALTDTIARRGALIIAFNRPSDYSEPTQPLLRLLPAHKIASFPDGDVLALDDSVVARVGPRRPRRHE